MTREGHSAPCPPLPTTYRPPGHPWEGDLQLPELHSHLPSAIFRVAVRMWDASNQNRGGMALGLGRERCLACLGGCWGHLWATWGLGEGGAGSSWMWPLPISVPVLSTLGDPWHLALLARTRGDQSPGMVPHSLHIIDAPARPVMKSDPSPARWTELTSRDLRHTFGSQVIPPWDSVPLTTAQQ